MTPKRRLAEQWAHPLPHEPWGPVVLTGVRRGGGGEKQDPGPDVGEAEGPEEGVGQAAAGGWG